MPGCLVVNAFVKLYWLDGHAPRRRHLQHPASIRLGELKEVAVRFGLILKQMYQEIAGGLGFS